MSSSTTIKSTATLAPIQRGAIAMPRRVSFGATPVPSRPPHSRELSKTTSTTSSKTSELHHKFVPADKMKSMSDLDKEKESHMAKTHKEKAKKGVAGWMAWLEKKIMGGAKN